MTIAEGTRLSGKYDLVRKLGEGGMGVVWLAKHIELGAEVAIKVLRAGVLHDKEAVTRFDREARAAASLRGAHITRILDVGRADDGTPYMVMEYLDGSDLGARISEQGAQPLEFTIDVMLQACEGMAEAHARGVVHRDLKPENLFIVEVMGKPNVKILDFGISKFQADGDLRVTQTQTSFGTPLYMSPEQIRSTKNVDHRTDVWALGVILYESLTGQPPFWGESPTAVAVAVSVEKFKPLLERRPDLPSELEDVVQKALQKDANLRYQSVDELARALEPFRNGVSMMAPSTRGPETPGHVSVSNTMRVSSLDVPVRGQKRSTGLLAATGFLAVVLVGVIGFLALRGRNGVDANGRVPVTASDKGNADATATRTQESAAPMANGPDLAPLPPAASASAADSPRVTVEPTSAGKGVPDKKAGASATPATTSAPTSAPASTGAPHPDATAKPKTPERNPEFL